MKKTPLFLAVLSTIVLASCADDEPLAVQSIDNDGISFRSGLASRATETTNANLKSIYVTAFTDSAEYFENESFVKGTDSYFTSPKKFTWLNSNTKINFFAYSPSQDELGADVNVINGKHGIELTDFCVAEDVADQVDFITANASGTRSKNENTGVELTFDHRLAQIQLQAKSENTTYTYKVVGARIGRAEYKGTFDFTTNKWTLDDWHDTYVYDIASDTITLNATPQSLMGKGGNAMLLPQHFYAWDPIADPDNVAHNAYLSVLVQITRTDNGFRVYPYPDDKEKDDNGNLRQYAWASVPLSGTW